MIQEFIGKRVTKNVPQHGSLTGPMPTNIHPPLDRGQARRHPNRLAELETKFTVLAVQVAERNTTSIGGRNMEQAGISWTESFWNRSRSAASTSLIFLQKMFIYSALKLLAAVVFLSIGFALQTHAQTASTNISTDAPGGSELPDAPSASPTPQQSTQPSRPFQPPPFSRNMTIGDKFKYMVEPEFGPRSLFTNAFGAGIRMANPPSHYPPEWHGGAEAFGRFYGDSFARTGAEGIGRFTASVLLHEDPRYQRSESTFFPARLGHSLLYSFVDKTDSGHTTVAISNFTGAAAGGFIGNAYLPAGFDNLTHAGQRSSIVFGSIAAQNIAQEFAPELGRYLKKLHLAHIPKPPVWWTENNH